MFDPGFYRGKSVLVTGHTGFKGAWLSLWLQRMGARVTGYALAPSTVPSLFGALDLGRLAPSVIADIRDTPRLAHAFGESKPEIVFHLAAQALVGASYQDPLETFSTNVVGTAAVLDACRANESVRAAVVVTSDKCYEVQRGDRGLRETDPMGGHDPYSASKGCTELVASSYRRSFFAKLGKGLATARAGNVIGGGDFTTGRLVPDCLAAFSAGEAVRLRYPASVRPWQHVLEPLSGYLLLGQRLFEAPATWSEAWNFGPDDADARPVREVVERCAKRFGSKASWMQEPGDHPHETAVLRLDSTLARTRLGWRPSWNLDAALEHTVAWHQAFCSGADMAEITRAQIAAHEAHHA
jgi:CDP-glucose 4,6-dehydratase